MYHRYTARFEDSKLEKRYQLSRLEADYRVLRIGFPIWMVAGLLSFLALLAASMHDTLSPWILGIRSSILLINLGLYVLILRFKNRSVFESCTFLAAIMACATFPMIALTYDSLTPVFYAVPPFLIFIFCTLLPGPWVRTSILTACFAAIFVGTDVMHLGGFQRQHVPMCALYFVAVLGGAIIRRSIEVMRREQWNKSRQLEVALEQAKAITEVARREAQSKSDLIAIMSHEIRTPLNGILGIAQILKETDTNSVQDKHLHTILASGTSLLSLINNILDMSKIDAKAFELEDGSFDLEELIQGAIDAVAGCAMQNELPLNAIIPPELCGNYAGDGTRFRQVLINLLGNAVKFTASGEITLSVTMDAEDQLRFEVQDNGPGVAPELQQIIFQRFQQGDRKLSDGNGTGLGLSIAKDIVTLAGGEIGVISPSGEGATFWFTIPGRRLSAPEIKTEKEISVAHSNIDLGGLRILLVDDNSINRMVVRTFLQRHGIAVTEAKDAEQALSMLETSTFDLILMDIEMPGMKGDEAIKRIRNSNASFSDVPIVALTAHRMSGLRERYRAMGANEYLSKPTKSEELVSIIESVLTESENTKRLNLSGSSARSA